MKRSVFQSIILVLASLIFGFIIALIPTYFQITEVTQQMITIALISMMGLLFAVLIVLFVYSIVMINKTRFVSTLIPLRMHDSIKDDGVMIFYRNMNKLVRNTKRSIIYITYPVDRYNTGKLKHNVYSKVYYHTKAGRELKAFHKQLIQFVKKLIKDEHKMYFRMYIQNISTKPENMDDIERESLDTEIKDKFFTNIEELKTKLIDRDTTGSVIDTYNLLSNQEMIALISDNSRMLVMTKLLDRYVCSYVKDTATVKDFVTHLSLKLP